MIMISILIPIYNFDCRALIKALHSQIVASGKDCEIIVADDASCECRSEIDEISRLPYVRFFQFSENQGRSKIRNFLASKALRQYLLFIDCDAEVCSDRYLQNYIDTLKPGICCSGGIAPYPYYVSQKYALNYIYNKNIEVKHHTNGTLTTFNFLIDKSIFDKCRFNEKIIRYGHEDTLLAIGIREHTQILFIGNSLVHKHLNTNDEFIAKNELACESLPLIKSIISDDIMRKNFRLWNAYSIIHSLKLDAIAADIFNKNRAKIKRRLCLSHKPSLPLLNLYKLGYICFLMRNAG